MTKFITITQLYCICEYISNVKKKNRKQYRSRKNHGVKGITDSKTSFYCTRYNADRIMSKS